MQRLIVSLSTAAVIAAGAVAGLQAAATASTTAIPAAAGGGGTQAPAAASRHNPPDLSFTTTMISYTPVNVGAAGLSPGDGYVLAGHVTRHGTADGLSTAHCTYTITTAPVLRVCTVDYALNNGLITTSGYIDGPGKSAPVTLVVNGGTGAFAGARGYGRLQPTPAGSTVTLHLTG
jgi:hypothetical protein